MRAKRNRRIFVLTRVALGAELITAVKLAFHAMGWEFISINPLFSALVASTVFRWSTDESIPLLRHLEKRDQFDPSPAG